MTRLLAALLPLAALSLAACEDTGGPCDDYVAYMCDCHEDDAGCSELATIYDSPDADLQDECVIALDEQEAADDEAGFTCEGDTGDTGEA